MQIKSWQIALIGSLSIVIYTAFRVFSNTNIVYTTSYAVLVLIPSIIVIVPVLLLRSDKTKSIGAVIALIIGIYTLGDLLKNYNINQDMITGKIVGLWLSVFLLAASIHYFWKKV